MQQTTNTILLVQPKNIRTNEQTAVNNHYQKIVANVLPNTLQLKAQQEFDALVNKLESVGVNVLVFEPKDNLDTPDAHFPNNWISFHENGDVALYPMFAKNRRLERREEVLDFIENNGFDIKNVVDYTQAEQEGFYLEGTGSLVLDRQNRKAYCALSARTDEELSIEFCEDFEYTPVIFTAHQTVNEKREPIYHTNVMMCIAETFAIICLESIDDKKERKNVLKNLKEDAKDIVAITEQQVSHFVGNMLQIKGSHDKLYLIMSQAAFNSLTPKQINSIEKHCEILSSSLETIEACGGGSIRCMMAEVFLPKA